MTKRSGNFDFGKNFNRTSKLVPAVFILVAIFMVVSFSWTAFFGYTVFDECVKETGSRYKCLVKMQRELNGRGHNISIEQD